MTICHPTSRIYCDLCMSPLTTWVFHPTSVLSNDWQEIYYFLMALFNQLVYGIHGTYFHVVYVIVVCFIYSWTPAPIATVIC